MADEKKVTDAEVAAKKAKKTEKKKDAKKAPSKFSPKNVGKRIARFFKDLKGEKKKIMWPDAKMVVKSTGIVLATILVIGVGVWVVDFALSRGISAISDAANNTETTVVETTHEHNHDEEDATEETTEEETTEEETTEE